MFSSLIPSPLSSLIYRWVDSRILSGWILLSDLIYSYSKPIYLPFPPSNISMASFLQSLPVCTAVRKQSTAVPFTLHKASQSIVSLGPRSSYSTLSSSASLTSARKFAALSV